MGTFMALSRRRKFAWVTLTLVLLAGYIFAIRPFIAALGGTMVGPLDAHSSDIGLDDAVHLLARVPSAGFATDSSLRFAAMPSFGHRWMAVSLARTPTVAIGKVAVLERSTGKVSIRSFEMPVMLYDDMVRHWDEESDGYWGELSMWADGTPIGFERKRGLHVTSGLGNSPCHFDVLGNLAATYIGPNINEMNVLRSFSPDRLRKSAGC